MHIEEPRVADRRVVSPEGRERYDLWQREKVEVERRLEIIDAQTQVLLRIMARNRS